MESFLGMATERLATKRLPSTLKHCCPYAKTVMLPSWSDQIRSIRLSNKPLSSPGRDLKTVNSLPTKVLFAGGEFDGERFFYDNDADPFFPVETGDEFANPVTFPDKDGRRILISWLLSTKMSGSATFSAPRELLYDLSDKLVMLPVHELRDRCVNESRFVSYDDGRLNIRFEGRTLFSKAYAVRPEMKVLEDVGTVEVFINGGRENISMFIC